MCNALLGGLSKQNIAEHGSLRTTIEGIGRLQIACSIRTGYQLFMESVYCNLEPTFPNRWIGCGGGVSVKVDCFKKDLGL